MEKHKIEWKDFQSLIKLYEPRWYQKDVLQNKSIKKIIRGGRRVGKTEIMCLTALYKAITNPSFKIMFAAPYKSQVKIFFEKIKSIINNSSLSSPTLRTTSTNVIEMKFNKSLNFASELYVRALNELKYNASDVVSQLFEKKYQEIKTKL